MRETGTVRWWNDERGFGFIERGEGDDPDLYVHFTKIDGSGYKSLHAGDRVSFTVGLDPKGRPEAQRVRVDERPQPEDWRPRA